MRLTVLPLLMSLTVTTSALADDVYVNGYYKSDGTHVNSYVRSSPDASISNNYGPSQSSYERMNPRSRDYDNDGVSNTYDYNSDNDRFSDERDANPYGGGHIDHSRTGVQY